METLFKFRYIIITSLTVTVNYYNSFCGLSNIRHFKNDSLYYSLLTSALPLYCQ